MDERIARAVQGDAEALSALLVEHHDLLLRHLEAQMSDGLRAFVDPEDLLQETLVAAFQDVARFTPQSDDAFRRWLLAIADHRLLDAARYRNAQRRGGEVGHVSSQVEREGALVSLFDLIADDLSTPSVKASRREGVAELNRQLAKLPDDYRLALELRHLRDLSVEATAAQMGRSLDEVRGLLYRARRKLAELMGASSLFQFRR